MHLLVKSGVHERRKTLDKHFTERGVYDYFEDVHWIDEYPPDHPFVIWLNKTHLKNLSRKQISGCMKAYHAMKLVSDLADDDDDMFMHVDDDVVFLENWKDAIDKLPSKLVNITSLGVNFHVDPGVKYIVTGNIGGCESIVFSKKFADFFVKNVDFGQAQDIVIGAMMLYHGLPLGIVPVCQQTSILGDVEPGALPKYEKDWITFTRTYRPTGVSFDSLLKEYQEFSERKKFVEDDFFDRFSTKIDIWNLEYIDQRYKVLRALRAQ